MQTQQQKTNIEKMIAWATDKANTVGPETVQLTAWLKVPDMKGYILTQLEIMSCYKSTNNRIYQAAYYRLYEVKQYFDNLQKQTK